MSDNDKADMASVASYDPHAVEADRQAAWRERDAFRTALPAEGQPCTYVKASAPFTSGNIHIGHVRSYSIGDAYARFCRARGEAVLFAFGFDAFGLPAELQAIANDEPPTRWVTRCAEHMTGQLQRLGFSFDWERTFMSSDAVMYRWSQWLFLTLLEAGLIYQDTGNVDWCDTCQTTLATIQVENGLCWRCHNPVRLITRPQWYLRISAYVGENDRRLDELAQSGIWDETSLASQRYVLGRTDGVEFEMRSTDGESLTVFTPHSQAIGQARFVLVSPRHPEIERWAQEPDVAGELEELRSGGWERSAREAESIAVIDTRRSVMSAGGSALPVFISPVVDERFGPTAVLGIPESDRTDAVIAQRLAVSAPDEHTSAGLTAVSPLPAVRYRAFDFSISRQRSWGTPIPILYCETCGTVPVPQEQLPVLLPLDLKPTGTGNPLAELPEFVQSTCPSCGGKARRETDTLDCHFDALWLWIPACVPAQERERSMQEIFALDDLRAWLPSRRLVAGSDSGNFVFDQRITTKALRDIGPLSFLEDGEPFAGSLFHEMVIREGRKMSKHLGNVVDPDELLARYGADTVRLAVLYAARPQRSLNWSDSAVAHCHRFLGQLWEYSQRQFHANGAGLQSNAQDIPALDTDHLRKRLAKWSNAAVERITEDFTQLEMHSAVRNVMRLFDRIKDYEKRVIAKRGELGQADSDALVEALELLITVLEPLAPHIAQELLIAAGRDESGETSLWPTVPAGVPSQ